MGDTYYFIEESDKDDDICNYCGAMVIQEKKHCKFCYATKNLYCVDGTGGFRAAICEDCLKKFSELEK